MKTIICYESIQIGEQRIECYSYYYGIWDREEDHRICVQHTIWQWAAGLQQLGSACDEVYLPYFLDDEWVDCLRAKLNGNKVVLQSVRIDSAGYCIDLNDISDVLFRTHQDLDRDGDVLGEYELNALIASFEQAEIEQD